MGPVTSRERIAQQADEAARWWVAAPNFPKPKNPFDEAIHPEHHAEWKASFERYLLVHSAPAAEGGA